MAKKINWADLKHEQRLQVLSSRSREQILQEYELSGASDAEFQLELDRENALWIPSKIGKFKTAGEPPTKEVVLGAWRDLERAEALLELIDNSIDTWLVRRALNPRKAAKELNIFIGVDPDLGLLTYEDNAGGVPEEKLIQLVIPGYSDTTPLSNTIGSYKTGGKKAIFRLAQAVQILTRYWSPAETSDDLFSVQLDGRWLADAHDYKFRYASVADKSVLEKGQTRYVLQLREEPLGGIPWFREPGAMDPLRDEIRRAYTLLLIRNPDIKIFLQSRAQAITPEENLYDFSGTKQAGVNIQPQQVVFDAALPFESKLHNIQLEIILGSRRTTGAADGGNWGIDLYGNDRLFVRCEQELFAGLLFTAGQSRLMVRGLINIIGPNVFIPWDTHKRHLNLDREIISILTTHRAVTDLFDNWKAIYNSVSRGKVSRLINTPLTPAIDRAKHDLFVPHRTHVKLDLKDKRAALPKSVWSPNVSVRTPKVQSVSVNFKFLLPEARAVASYYRVPGDLEKKSTRTDLAQEIKADVLKRATSRRKSK